MIYFSKLSQAEMQSPNPSSTHMKKGLKTSTYAWRECAYAGPQRLQSVSFHKGEELVDRGWSYIGISLYIVSLCSSPIRALTHLNRVRRWFDAVRGPSIAFGVRFKWSYFIFSQKIVFHVLGQQLSVWTWAPSNKKKIKNRITGLLQK